MATLIKHRNQYCSKIQKWNGIKQVSTKIPLRTNKKSVALVRHHKVEKSEKHIKEGVITKQQFKGYFPWLNDKGTSVSAGVYLYSIEAGEFRQTKKMILLK